jgi:hypothetical protein
MKWVTTPTCSQNGYTTVNRQYVALAAVHLVNAFMFAASWAPWLRENAQHKSWAFLSVIGVPEALNIVEAALYLTSSRHYAHSQKYCATYAHCGEYKLMHRLELAASVVELAASLFWAASWWLTHERGPRRGLNLWDVVRSLTRRVSPLQWPDSRVSFSGSVQHVFACCSQRGICCVQCANHTHSE